MHHLKKCLSKVLLCSVPQLYLYKSFYAVIRLPYFTITITWPFVCTFIVWMSRRLCTFRSVIFDTHFDLVLCSMSVLSCDILVLAFVVRFALAFASLFLFLVLCLLLTFRGAETPLSQTSIAFLRAFVAVVNEFKFITFLLVPRASFIVRRKENYEKLPLQEMNDMLVNKFIYFTSKVLRRGGHYTRGGVTHSNKSENGNNKKRCTKRKTDIGQTSDPPRTTNAGDTARAEATTASPGRRTSSGRRARHGQPCPPSRAADGSLPRNTPRRASGDAPRHPAPPSGTRARAPPAETAPPRVPPPLRPRRCNQPLPPCCRPCQTR